MKIHNKTDWATKDLTVFIHRCIEEVKYRYRSPFLHNYIPTETYCSRVVIIIEHSRNRNSYGYGYGYSGRAHLNSFGIVLRIPSAEYETTLFLEMFASLVMHEVLHNWGYTHKDLRGTYLGASWSNFTPDDYKWVSGYSIKRNEETIDNREKKLDRKIKLYHLEYLHPESFKCSKGSYEYFCSHCNNLINHINTCFTCGEFFCDSCFNEDICLCNRCKLYDLKYLYPESFKGSYKYVCSNCNYSTNQLNTCSICGEFFCDSCFNEDIDLCNRCKID